VARGTLARPLLAGLICQAVVGAVRPAISYRALDLGGDELAIGILAAAYALLPLLGALTVGRLAGRLRVVALVPLAGAVLLVVGCTVAVLAVDLVALGVASGLIGIGNLAVLLGAQAWIARSATMSGYDAAFGWLTAGMSLGQALGPLAAGFAVDGHGGPGVAFLAAGTGALLLAVLMISRAAPPVVGADLDEAVPGVRSMLASSRMRAAMVVSVALLTAIDVLTAYLPVLGEQAGVPPLVVGILLAVRGAASALSRVLLGPLSRRIPRPRLILASTVGGALTMGMVAASPALPVLAVAMVVGGFLLGLGQPLTMTEVALAVPHAARSEALALRLVGNRVAQLVVPLAGGAAALALGLGVVFWLQSALLAGSAVWSALSGVKPGRSSGPD
jgi:MFS family permease